MKVRLTFSSLLLLAMAFQLGCGFGYNTSFFTAEDSVAAMKYKDFKKRQDAVRAQVAVEQQIRSQPVQFHGGAGRSQGRISMIGSEKFTPMAGRQPTEFSPTKPRPRDKRFLYGQLHGEGETISSPMDGTSNLQQVTFATEGADFDPALDRTGKWLVYASTQHRPTSDLYIKAVNGTTIRQLTDDPDNDATPTFSPDGKWVAYASDRAGNWDIYLISTDGGPSEQLTNSPNDEIHPSFSSDGKQIVYCTSGSRSGQWEMAVIDVDNPATPKLIGHGLFPQWSPTDNRIVYQRAREQGSRYFGVWLLELVDSEGHRPTQIAASSNAAAITPRWSPDGKSIVFCTIVNPESDLQQGTPLQSDVWIINADGKGRANLTRSRFLNLQPVWAPDGTVYFVSNRGRNGMENVWAVRTEAALKVIRSDPEPQKSEQTAEAPAP